MTDTDRNIEDAEAAVKDAASVTDDGFGAPAGETH